MMTINREIQAITKIYVVINFKVVCFEGLTKTTKVPGHPLNQFGKPTFELRFETETGMGTNNCTTKIGVTIK
jgi:hypothetical protein